MTTVALTFGSFGRISATTGAKLRSKIRTSLSEFSRMYSSSWAT